LRAVAVTPGVSGSLRPIETPEPNPAAHEAVVRVTQVGICGTDMAIVGGMHCQSPSGSDFLIIGHESLGQVVDPGGAAGSLSPGDYVVATVRRPCIHGRCRPCRSGHTDMCLTGDFTERGIAGRHGYMAEYYAEDPRFLVKVPAQLAPVGALLEPLSVPEKGLRQVWKIQERLPWAPRKAVVLGAGPIGLLAAMLLRLRGIDTWVFDIASPGSAKASIASQTGAAFVNTADVPVSAIAQALGPVDVIVEATGYSPLAVEAIQQLGNNGVLCLLGMAAGANAVPIDSGAFNNALVTGNRLVVGSVNANLADFQAGVDDLSEFEKEWPGVAASMLNRRVPLTEYQTAFQRSPEDIKVTVLLD